MYIERFAGLNFLGLCLMFKILKQCHDTNLLYIENIQTTNFAVLLETAKTTEV